MANGNFFERSLPVTEVLLQQNKQCKTISELIFLMISLQLMLTTLQVAPAPSGADLPLLCGCSCPLHCLLLVPCSTQRVHRGPIAKVCLIYCHNLCCFNPVGTTLSTQPEGRADPTGTGCTIRAHPTPPHAHSSICSSTCLPMGQNELP